MKLQNQIQFNEENHITLHKYNVAVDLTRNILQLLATESLGALYSSKRQDYHDYNHNRDYNHEEYQPFPVQ